MKSKKMLEYLNTPLKNNPYLVRMSVLFVLMLFVGFIFGSSTFSQIFLFMGICLMFIFVRRRLIDIGWSKWLSLICILQFLVYIPTEELDDLGKLLLYFVFPGFLIILYFLKTDDI